MTMVEINWHPSRKELRVFAVLLIVFFAIVAAVIYQKTSSVPASITIVVVASIIGLLGWCVPNFMRVVYVTWMLAVFPIGFVISHVILAVVFYLVLTPIGCIMRLCGRDPMQRQFDSSASSYWVARHQENRPSRYFRQF